MDLKKRINILTKMGLGLSMVGFWMILLSCYINTSKILGEKSTIASNWLTYMAVEFMAIAMFIALYVVVYLSPATKNDEE